MAACVRSAAPRMFLLHIQDVVLHLKRKLMSVAIGMTATIGESLRAMEASLELLRCWGLDFASPLKLGKLPYSYTGVWLELNRAASAAGVGHLGTHAFRHTYRSCTLLRNQAFGSKSAAKQSTPLFPFHRGEWESRLEMRVACSERSLSQVPWQITRSPSLTWLASMSLTVLLPCSWLTQCVELS